MRSARLQLAALSIGLLALQGCLGRGPGQPPIQLASKVDIDRMYGGWHILATIPNGFEKGLVAPYDVYAPNPNGGIREDFYARSKSFAAPLKHFTVRDFIVPGSNNARWKVQIVWPIKLPFLLLYVDPNYRYVLFGEENRKLGWIYARKVDMDEPTYRSLLQQFKMRGYDIGQFRRWIQKPDQIGQPGYWNEEILK